MTTQISHFIDGQRTAGQSTRSADVFDPNTGQIQAKVPMAGKSDIDAAVASAVEAQKGWAAWNPQRRARVLMRFIELVNDTIDELAELLSREHGKTLADARGDVQRGIEVIEFCLGIPHLLKGEYTEGAGPGIDVYSLRQPLGVVAGITPFNFPAMIPLWKAGPALACGNAFVLKPSERDPSVPVRLAELFIEAGLPAGVFQVVHGDKEAVDAILHHPDIKAVGFVGSSDIAQYIYAGAAATGKRAQCFGGAKNHMIVMPDADLDQAVDALIGAGYGSAGERCMAISVAVPVGDQTAERLRARLIERINNLRVGHSLDPKADYGPLVTGAALARVRDYIGQGVAAGAELVVDGRDRASDDLTFGLPEGDANLEGGFFIGPTLFDHVAAHMSIYTDEIFGPVLCMVRARDYEEALRLPSEHEYGNGVAIFTRDGDAARDFVSRVQVGMVGVNVPIPVPVAYHTFGGWKRSAGKGGDYVLDGVKQFISGAAASDVYVVMARTGAEGPRGVSAFIVEKGTPGLSFGAPEAKMGWHAQPTAQVVLDGVRVPAEAMLGGADGEGAGFGIAMSGLNGGRLNIAACSLGGAQAAFDKAGAYVRDRQAFGGSLLDEPTVRFTLADMATGLQTSRMLLWRAASALDDDDADKVELCAMAKRYVTDTCFEVADQALQLHGGYGYLREYGLEKIVRDLRVHRILEGTNEIMRLVIGRAEAARFRATV